MIEFKNVEKVFNKGRHENKVLNQINLKIEKNDIFGVIGYSGAGKSTLIRLINGLEKPTSGEVFINEQSLSDCNDDQLRQVKRKIGMIFQGFNLLESKTVAQNIALPLLLSGVSKQEQNRIVDELLAFVELSDKKHAYPSALSGGQKQRVSIARALANKPDILLCDEATSALDPETTRSILDLLARINKEQQVTIVLVTHEMSVVKYICNHVLVMEKGHIVERGKVVDVFRSPKASVTKKFIRSVINDQLPAGIQNTLVHQLDQAIFRIEMFSSAQQRSSSQQSVINDLILQLPHQVRVNLLFSNMINIKCDVIGFLFIEIIGEPQALAAAIDFLKTQSLKITKLEQDGHYVAL